jgi:hypothetical protein
LIWLPGLGPMGVPLSRPLPFWGRMRSHVKLICRYPTHLSYLYQSLCRECEAVGGPIYPSQLRMYVAFGMMADFIISTLWSRVAQEYFSFAIFFRIAPIKWEALIIHSRESEMCTPRYLYVARGGRQGYVVSPPSGCVGT